MRIFRGKRTALVLAATVAVLAAVLAGLVTTSRTHSASPQVQRQDQARRQGAPALLAGRRRKRRRRRRVRGSLRGAAAVGQHAHRAGHRRPGCVLGGLRQPPGPERDAPAAWNEVTRVPYDADDPDYRDYYSNSSGGAGLVTGRITGARDRQGRRRLRRRRRRRRLALDDRPRQLAPIADNLPSLSSGDLQIDPTGALWYGTGEANTGGTSYVGSGVYRLANPASGTFSRLEPHRRHRAREHDDPPPALLGRHRLRGDAARRLLALGQRPGRDAVEAALRAEPVVPAGRRGLRRPERRLPEHRQRPRGRPEEREAPDRRGGLARRRCVQRLLRVERRAARRGRRSTRAARSTRRTSATRRSRSRPTAASST